MKNPDIDGFDSKSINSKFAKQNKNGKWRERIFLERDKLENGAQESEEKINLRQHSRSFETFTKANDSRESKHVPRVLLD